MDCPGYRFIFDALLWVVFLAFLPKNYLIMGTGYDVFNQTPTKEIYVPDYDIYHNLSQLNQCIYELISRFPNVLEAEMRFRSRWGLSQYVLHFGNLSEPKTATSSKVRILLSFGEHSSEYLPVESMIYLLQNLTAGIKEPFESVAYNFTRFVIENVDLYLIGLFNPDGRSVVEKTKNYCWKETGSGANLNMHQYDFATTVPRQVVVEPECRVLTELTSQFHFDIIISFHSGEKKIFVPLTDFDSKPKSLFYPDDKEVLSLTHLLSTSNGLKHVYINQSLNHYGESIFSYAATTRKIPFTYLISIWRNTKIRQKNDQENCFASSNPSSKKLQEVVKSFHPFYNGLFKYMVKWKKSKLISIAGKKKANKGFMSSSYGTTLLFIIMFIIILITRINLPLGWRLFYRRQRRIVSLRSLSSVFSFFIQL